MRFVEHNVCQTIASEYYIWVFKRMNGILMVSTGFFMYFMVGGAIRRQGILWCRPFFIVLLDRGFVLQSGVSTPLPSPNFDVLHLLRSTQSKFSDTPEKCCFSLGFFT